MRSIAFKYLITSLVVLLISSCGSDGPTGKEIFIESITGTWEIDESSYVIIDDQNIAELFIGFKITISSDLTFTSNSNELTLTEFPWPTSGSFILNDELTQFTRDDGLVIDLILRNDERSLDMEFTADENTIGGRVRGVRGGWRVGLNRK